MLTFSSLRSSQTSSYLEHAVVHLVLQDGLAEVPKCVLRPQDGLEHQAGVGGLGKRAEEDRRV